jgi:hypothetical protein
MAGKTIFAICLLLTCATIVSADLYIHNPRGSNNRCDEQNNNAQDQTRLFNSQNNAAGGYPVAPSMYYYVGSVLSIEWTNQHSCGGGADRIECQLVFQYGCEDAMPRIRDGVPANVDGNGNNGNTCVKRQAQDGSNSDPTVTGNERFGEHETFAYFTDCNTRQRNKGLFTADESVTNNGGAQATRQNPDANTNGFECQEERDYWPYWHPTPWTDIAVMTSNMTLCDFYQKNSENVLGRYYCKNAPQFNNEQACRTGGGAWTQAPAKNKPKPECVVAPWNRDNHLGSKTDGQMNAYNWTIPNDVHSACVLRMRYNISSYDFARNLDFRWNSANPGGNDNIDYNEVSPVTDDPYMSFKDASIGDSTSYLRMAMDTSQFGRTFQDRSWVFEIRKRPAIPATTEIYNLNVRGKRGNIAQVRNCLEYDFAPQRLHVPTGAYIHIQWTGSNHQPGGNAGEGRTKWDRHNMIQIRGNILGGNYPMTIENQTMFDSKELAYRAAFTDQHTNTACDPINTLVSNNNDQPTTNCAKLNGNPTGYFDLGLVRMNRTGMYNYMNSRNNNFTNRTHRATLLIGWGGLPTWAMILLGIVLGVAAIGAVSAACISYSRKHPSSRISRFGEGMTLKKPTFGSGKSKAAFGGVMI